MMYLHCYMHCYLAITLKEIVLPTQIMAEKPEFRFFYFVLEDYNFCFENCVGLENEMST